MESAERKQIDPLELRELYFKVYQFVLPFVEEDMPGIAPATDIQSEYIRIKDDFIQITQSSSFKLLKNNPATRYDNWPIVPPITIWGMSCHHSLDAMIVFIQDAMIWPKEILDTKQAPDKFYKTLKERIQGHWKDCETFYRQTAAILNHFDFELLLFNQNQPREQQSYSTEVNSQTETVVISQDKDEFVFPDGQVFYGETELKLTGIPRELLRLLWENKGRLVSNDILREKSQNIGRDLGTVKKEISKHTIPYLVENIKREGYILKQQ